MYIDNEIIENFTGEAVDSRDILSVIQAFGEAEISTFHKKVRENI